jgi:signal peptidase
MKSVGNILRWLGYGVYAACTVLIVMFLVPVGGWKALNVLTGSMRPTIQPGTLVLIHHVSLHDIKPGDIVTYETPHDFKKTITHRVVSIKKVDGVNMVTVKGDANLEPDTPFPGGLIVGRVAMIIPGAGKFIGYLHNAWGLALLVIIPGLLVIWSEIRNLKRALAQPNASDSDPRPPSEPPSPPKPNDHGQTETPPAPRQRRSMDGMRRTSTAAMVVVLLSAASGSALAATSVGKVKLKHNTFSVSGGQPPSEPQTIYDCLGNGWKKYGFPNVGQCVVYVVQHGSNPVPPPPVTPPPAHPPLPTLPPVFHHDVVTSTPTPVPAPVSSPVPSATPGASPSPSPTPSNNR